MPIEKGREWGEPGVLPTDAPIAGDDAELAALITSEHPVVAVNAGDVARTLGVRAPVNRTGTKQLLPIDAITVELDDGSRHVGIAHALVGHPWRSSTFIAIMNAAFLGTRNIAPRAHPGDGKADVVTMNLAFADRIKAWRRMPMGSHVPHPSISIARRSSGTIELDEPAVVSIDGRRVARSRSISYQVEPNAIMVAV